MNGDDAKLRLAECAQRVRDAFRDEANALAVFSLRSREPSLRIVSELTSLLAVAPIIFGVAVLVAKPWPDRARSPKAQPFGALDAVARGPAQTTPVHARTGVKFAGRAPPIEIRARGAGSSVGEAQSERPEPATRATGGAQAAVAEDGSLLIDGEKIRLEGVSLPDADAACRRLDGVEVRCLERIAARLSLIAQHGRLNCRTSIDAAGERVGRCAAGKIDLAQDLLRAQLARPARKPGDQGA